jgi:putative Mg2+ transporter-C (MgtC) family protein
VIELYAVLFARLVLACVLGGIIGYERENMHRPAGFRTHILVCVGSALVMATSEFIFRKYSASTSIDPARLGAQVISGIGFLGAGTIIREGFSVKGLTTAASLWAVSCVGIAAGIGFYEGAITASALILTTLLLLKKFEDRFNKHNKYRLFYIQSENVPGQITNISAVFDKYDVQVKSMDFIRINDGKGLQIKIVSYIPDDSERIRITNSLYSIEGVLKVLED